MAPPGLQGLMGVVYRTSYGPLNPCPLQIEKALPTLPTLGFSLNLSLRSPGQSLQPLRTVVPKV